MLLRAIRSRFKNRLPGDNEKPCLVMLLICGRQAFLVNKGHIVKILIADDEVKLRSIFKTILSREFSDISIDAVVNGAEAVDAFRAVNYDVLLMDLYMPVQDGYGACLEIQEICGKEKLKMPYVIFCTGYTAPKEIIKLVADKNHYALLSKPVEYKKLIDAIKAVK